MTGRHSRMYNAHAAKECVASNDAVEIFINEWKMPSRLV